MLGMLVTPQVVQKLMQHNTVQEGDDEGEEDKETSKIDEQESFFHEPSNFRIASQFVQSESAQPQRRVTISDDLPSVRANVDYPEGYDESKLNLISTFCLKTVEMNFFPLLE